METIKRTTHSLRSVWRTSSTATKVIVILVAMAIFGGIVNGGKAKTDASSQAVKPTVTTTVNDKNLGQRVFSSSLIDYSEKDGKIAVSFEAFKMTKDSVEGDVKRFMRDLAKQDGWSSATVNAFGTTTDSYGAQSKKVAYTVTFSREEAMKVVDWNRADIVKVGVREFAIPQLLD